MRELGRMMVSAGAALVVVGALVWLAAHRGGGPSDLDTCQATSRTKENMARFISLW
jgi:hypothetical protein